MRLKLKSLLFLLAAGLITAAALVIVQNIRPEEQVHAQTGGSRSPAAVPAIGDFEAARREAGRSSISDLLRKSSVPFEMATAGDESAAASSTFHVLLETAAGRDGDAAGGTSLKVLGKPKFRNAQLRLQRSFELSPTLVVIFAVDEANRIVWWELKPDPRIQRAETADAQGNLEGQTFLRPSADMLISLPVGKNINAVHVFSPAWDGTGYTLMPLGTFETGRN